MKDLISVIQYIVSRSSELKKKFSDDSNSPVEFACIFCQNEEEYGEFTNSIEKLGKVVEDTKNGFTYLLDKPMITTAGPLKLVKIRKPDSSRPERGDADFNVDYESFGKRYQNNPKFELIKRESFEMLRLRDLNFDVLACFSNIPKSKELGIKL